MGALIGVPEIFWIKSWLIAVEFVGVDHQFVNYDVIECKVLEFFHHLVFEASSVIFSMLGIRKEVRNIVSYKDSKNDSARKNNPFFENAAHVLLFLFTDHLIGVVDHLNVVPQDVLSDLFRLSKLTQMDLIFLDFVKDIRVLFIYFFNRQWFSYVPVEGLEGLGIWYR